MLIHPTCDNPSFIESCGEISIMWPGGKHSISVQFIVFFFCLYSNEVLNLNADMGRRRRRVQTEACATRENKSGNGNVGQPSVEPHHAASDPVLWGSLPQANVTQSNQPFSPMHTLAFQRGPSVLPSFKEMTNLYTLSLRWNSVLDFFSFYNVVWKFLI